jgi:hypothetical protein
MSSPLKQFIDATGLKRAARGAADWVDLAYSHIVEQLEAVAPRTHGRLLDVGCGVKPYEYIFRPYVSEYIGVEYAKTFDATANVKKDGIVVVVAPFSFRLHEEPNDFFRYSPHGLRAMFDTAGLAVEEIWSQGDLWTVLGHKLNSYLAFRVARLDALAQMMGKLGHEDARTAPPRFWTFPVVLPAMGLVSACSRLLDRIAPDGSETLSYQVIGRVK